jgi:DNA invertase Pin-like site-specific DNA recombinase
MAVNPDETTRLLQAVRDATAEGKRLRQEARRIRRESVRAAMDAGVPRQEIADAAGVHRNLIYRIADSD